MFEDRYLNLFPLKVWFATEGGWAGKPPDSVDVLHRNALNVWLSKEYGDQSFKAYQVLVKTIPERTRQPTNAEVGI